MKDNLYLLVIIAMIGASLLVTSFILLTIYNRNKLLREKRKLQEAELNYQKELLYAVIDSQEKERQRIGMDLHDEVGSSLSSLRLLMENFTETLSDAPATHNFSMQSKFIIDKVIAAVRNISHDLSPLGKGTYDFIDALEDLKDMVNQPGKIRMVLDVQVSDLSMLTDTASLAIYRVVAELINNTLKHSFATKIVLLIFEQEGRFHFNYEDNGPGIKKNETDLKNGIGMKNIESRLRMIGAGFSLNEGIKTGFKLCFTLPSQSKSEL